MRHKWSSNSEYCAEMDGMRNFKQFTPLIVALFSRVAFESFALHDAVDMAVADKALLSGLQRP
jgi:hypothetical protein